MKQSWQNNINLAFKWHISVNRHVAKDMLDVINELVNATELSQIALDKLVYNSELMTMTVGLPEGKKAMKVNEQILGKYSDKECEKRRWAGAMDAIETEARQ